MLYSSIIAVAGILSTCIFGSESSGLLVKAKNKEAGDLIPSLSSCCLSSWRNFFDQEVSGYLLVINCKVSYCHGPHLVFYAQRIGVWVKLRHLEGDRIHIPGDNLTLLQFIPAS